ncbi:uroporphyrinogen decarboxylase family protein [Tichowtungia aerotolerans]|uniref:Uroporphyrinogen decarboxylase (URO-D) domain-containing protein n=1 Tax=Tichowtungia aerotolerans TaxID=2697043 RepID=A0A6P1MC43_9BACT|nr:uroporphyrinogen decarboxylase family protein [Tichowtungia aerotolerans]QHI70124.1 hypothetical protein GT409_11945 [Tichowtungia aerotolerans]
MTSKERVAAIFNGELPDRVPMWHGLSTEFIAKALGETGLPDEEALRVRMADDFRRIHASYDLPEETLAEGVVYRTVFGVNRMGEGYGQPVGHVLSDVSLSEIHDYPWPDPACVNVSTLREQAAPWKESYSILGGDWSPLWHDAIDLMGMETLYMRMYDEPEAVDALLTHLTDFYAASCRKIFDEAGDLIDVFFMGNDLGSQTGPLMGPEQFERFILPHLKRLIDLAHDYGLKTQLHCCGGIYPLIPMLIDAGLDALHALQPDCHGMGLRELKDAYGNRIVLNGAIDSHHTLINGNPDKVHTDVQKVLAVMKPGGRYIAGASHDWVLEQTPVENMLEMVDAVQEFGTY